MKNDKQRYLTILSEGVLEPLRPLIDQRDALKVAIERLQKAVDSEESATTELSANIEILEEEVINLLAEAKPTADQTSHLRGLRGDLTDRQGRIEGLKSAISSRREDLVHVEHDLLLALQQQVMAVRKEAQSDLDKEIDQLVDRMQSWEVALQDLVSTLGFPSILTVGSAYRTRSGQIGTALFTEERIFFLDPRSEALEAYLESRFAAVWRNLG